MSNKPLTINKSSSTKPKRHSYNVQVDLGIQSSNLKHRPVSSLKIEDKLINQKVTYNKRLESLKKTLEEEMLKDIRSKPEISKKSRVLAEKAEKRMMQQYAVVKSSPQPKKIEEYTQVQPDNSVRNPVSIKTPKRAISVTPTGNRTVKKKSKSLLALNVLERGDAWLAAKQKKIDLKKKNKEEMELVECTFSPKTVNKIKGEKSIRDESSNISFVSSPNSVDVSDFCDQNSKVAKSKQNLYKKIAPYQVNISFRCGIDLNSFLKRAK